MRKFVVFIYVSIVSSVAFANSESISEEVEQCALNDSYGALVICTEEVAQKADKELNRLYKTLVDYLDSPEEEQLRNAQRKWIAFRDSDCLFTSPIKKQPATPYERVSRASCLTRKTLDRVREFERIIEWPLGCNGCPF